MNREVLWRSHAGRNWRKPLLADHEENEGKERRRVGEVAGGTAAECAAICCCFPCTVMNLLILAVYKVPTGLCRKAWRKKKLQHLKKKKTVGLLANSGSNHEEGKLELALEMEVMKGGSRIGMDNSDVVNLEKEMWERFSRGGFWRSPSERERPHPLA
ncbi:uncharacterized protein LOC122292917 [Carya illinoinensis]|uniref:Uncharacterized protein n=1 Tax=Carya illinoinensis TaxID=32201 RepID=A0A8T1NNK4_CARIL|nr:uncharacterized protein LOC122292917 [Carya illinoinensis]KAG6631975.1 hypothetical protein CIPAW_13G126200 [Carya illinoinensis]KAG6682161.1 hypothetical protein I3842_13G124400 [Carya illinoinensis]